MIFTVLSIAHLLYDFVKDLILAFNAVSGKTPLVAEHHTPLSEGEPEAEEEVKSILTTEEGGSA